LKYNAHLRDARPYRHLNREIQSEETPRYWKGEEIKNNGCWKMKDKTIHILFWGIWIIAIIIWFLLPDGADILGAIKFILALCIIGWTIGYLGIMDELIKNGK